MSLVEKALKKLQESRDASATGARAPRRRPPSDQDIAPIASLDAAPAKPAAEPRRAPVARQSSKVVVVNRVALRAAGLLPPEHQERMLADQYRQIKRPLIAAAMGKAQNAPAAARLIMVTSALPGDGKTFTSINLSMSMSLEKDVNILLIDADVAKPHISRLFGVEQELGLLDALQNESFDIESLIIPTDVPGLSILPAGRRSETATELLASQRMETLMSALESNDPQRIVIIDSPPLLLTSESRALAQRAGQIVVVVRAAKTLQQDLLDAISHLPQGKATGIVLNQSVATSPGYYYGSGEAGRASVPSP